MKASTDIMLMAGTLICGAIAIALLFMVFKTVTLDSASQETERQTARLSLIIDSLYSSPSNISLHFTPKIKHSFESSIGSFLINPFENKIAVSKLTENQMILDIMSCQKQAFEQKWRMFDLSPVSNDPFKTGINTVAIVFRGYSPDNLVFSLDLGAQNELKDCHDKTKRKIKFREFIPIHASKSITESRVCNLIPLIPIPEQKTINGKTAYYYPFLYGSLCFPSQIYQLAYAYNCEDFYYSNGVCEFNSHSEQDIYVEIPNYIVSRSSDDTGLRYNKDRLVLPDTEFSYGNWLPYYKYLYLKNPLSIDFHFSVLENSNGEVKSKLSIDKNEAKAFSEVNE